MSSNERGNPRATWFTMAIESAKRHPVVVVVCAVVAVAGFVFTVADQPTRASGRSNAHGEEYAALDSLDLDTTPQFLEDNFGRAQKSIDLCRYRPCPPPVRNSLRMYIYKSRDFAVRAVFEDQSLELYAVTVMSPELAPRMKWLGYDLGKLGEATSRQALLAADNIGPTDIAVFMGPNSAAYADVVSVGAPGHYRGLFLAWAPDGNGGPKLSFALDAAQRLAIAQATGAPMRPRLVARFRSGTTPNTFGQFRDDGGYVGTLAQDADKLISLLYEGTDF
jgi:hypothetical protein